MKASLRSISPLIILAMLIISKIGFANEYYVTEVMDGGTIKVVYGDNKDLTVRLVGIDAPEASSKKDDSDQPFSNQATNRLASLVLNRIVEIKFYGSGGHDRTLGEAASRLHRQRAPPPLSVPARPAKNDDSRPGIR